MPLPATLRLTPRQRLLGRQAGVLIVMLLSLWLARHHLTALDAGLVWQQLQVISARQWLLAMASTILAFAAVAAQEAAVNSWLGTADRGTRSTGMAAAAVSQVVGLGPVVGTLIRLRLRPDLGLPRAAAITGAMSLLFLAGLALFLLCTAPLTPHPIGLPWALPLAAALMLALVGLARRVGLPRLPFRVAILMMLAVWLDICALGLSFWVLMPDTTIPLWSALPVFGLALGAGLLAGSPAGAGPFEAVVLAQLGSGQGDSVAAGMIAFRLVSYGLPALLAAGWMLVARRKPRPARLPALETFPQAEVQLCRQGNFTLAPVLPGTFWMKARLVTGEVLLGDPMTQEGTPDPRRCFTVLRGRPRLFYRIGPRTAATARKAGHITLRIAEEAILDPSTFRLDLPGRATLRRKLQKAHKAGVRVEEARAPCPDQMQEVHRDWVAQRGRPRGFTMGVWNPAFLRDQRVFQARTADGRLIAFLTFHATQSEWTLDLIRFRRGTPDGTLYALVQEALGTCRQEGVTRLSLAAAPAFGVGGPWGKLLDSLCSSGRGLRQFKDTFRPDWQPRYVAAANRLTLFRLLAETAWRIQSARAATR